MFDLLLQVLGAGLSLWDDKEKHKYIDKYLSLQKDYYDESNKPEADRDQAVLDNLSFELRLLSRAFVAGAGKQNAPG